MQFKCAESYLEEICRRVTARNCLELGGISSAAGHGGNQTLKALCLQLTGTAWQVHLQQGDMCTCLHADKRSLLRVPSVGNPAEIIHLGQPAFRSGLTLFASRLHLVLNAK